MKKNVFLGLAAIAAGLCMTACCNKTASNKECGDSLITLSGLNPANFASDSTGLYVLQNKAGMEVQRCASPTLVAVWSASWCLTRTAT